MSHLTISLLGGFEAILDDRPVTAFSTDKTRALLAYLAVESDRAHRRGELAAMLWPESSTNKAAHNLSQTLLRLRRALGEDVAQDREAHQPFLLLTPRDVQLNPLADYRLDVAEFLDVIRAYRQHQHMDAAGCRTCVGWLRQAADLYHGDLLAGFALRDSVPFEEWQLVRQESLHGQIIEVLDLLTTYHERCDEPARVLEYARRYVALEPWQEHVQVKLMRVLAECGQRAAALEQYAVYCRMLAKEYGLSPSAEASALYDRIRNHQIGSRDEELVGEPAAGRAAISSVDATSGLLVERGEQRQVTALVCCRFSSTKPGDPEDQIEQLARCRGECDAVLERYGGRRQQRQGTDCLIYFGYPVAYEDAARRAVHAGLKLVSAGNQTDQVHVGIHTGVMVCKDGDLMGAVPNQARECRQLSEPNSVFVTEDTQCLVLGWFDFQLMGTRSPHGSGAEVSVYRVMQESAVLSRLDWLTKTHRLTRFVGREREMAILASGLEKAQRGQGQVIALTGDPGIGKSRLVWELKQRLAPSITLLASYCSPYSQNTSLHPIVDVLGQLLGIADGDSPEIKRAGLDRTLERLDLARPTTAWLLALLLGLSTGASAPQKINRDLRERMRMAFVTLLTKCATEQPVVIVIEDLHWADPSTIEWLSASLGELAAARCLAVFTQRPAFSPNWHPQPHLHSLDIASLSLPEVERMVADLADGTMLPGQVRQRISAQSDGIPLFVEELARNALEAGMQPGSTRLPATLRDALLSRLDSVGVAKETAGWAASLGCEFTYAILAAIVPYDERRLQADLAALAEAGIIHTPAAALEDSFSFKHALLQEAAYASLLTRTRQAHHKRIAETYTTRFPQVASTQPEVVAQHYGEAGQHAQAVDYWLLAGARAAAQGATQEARAFYDRAISRIEPEDRIRRWRALTGREAILFLAGDRAAEQEDIAALLELADGSGDQEWRAEALLCQLRLLNATGDFAAIPLLADDAIAASEAAGKLGTQARALCLKAAALTRMGDSEARQTAEEAVTCGHAAGDEWAIAYATGMLALFEAYSGDYALAARFWGQVLELVRRCDDRTLESRALSNLGAAYQYLGLFDEARAHLEAGIALCDLIGDRQSRAYNVVNLGGVMLLRGDLPAAKELFEQGLAEAIKIDDECLRAGMLMDLGVVAAMSGDYAGATQYLEEARRIYIESEMTARVMEGNALLAKCAMGQHRPKDAGQCASQAWNYLQQHGPAAMDEAIPTFLAIAEVFEELAKLPGEGEIVPDAGEVIAAAHRLVMARAERISDPLWRRSFLENVPSNRAVLAWRQRIRVDAESDGLASP